jgi:predicted PurR-regulated permease PerM
MLTIGLFTFYMAAEGPKMRRAVCSIMRPERQVKVLRAWEIAIDKTGGYFYSRALLAGIGALVAWAVFAITGIPFAIALALWMGVLSQFVPVVGTYLGGALPLVIALLESPTKAIVVVVFVVVYQQLENYLLAPRITARTMALHPAVAFGAAIAGGTLMGVPGALMALPFAATVQAFVGTFMERHEVVDDNLTSETKRRQRPGGDAATGDE